MVNLNAFSRSAVLNDQGRIANLIYFESHVHRHLDWRSPLDWLGAPEYWVVERQNNVIAALACPPDPPGVAWIRLFAHSGSISPEEAWQNLWQIALQQSISNDHQIVAAITLQAWFEQLLRDSGFALHQQIVILDHSLYGDLQPSNLAKRIRPMTDNDLPVVGQIDNQAFKLLWQNSPTSLEMAFAQAGHATVLEHEGRIMGYQISTKNPFGAHLARLAVAPEAQGLGYGQALVKELLYQAQKQGYHRVTVNTQADNHTSLALYQKQGFQLTGERYPVYVLDADKAL